MRISEHTRICDLGLRLEESQFAPLIGKLHRELAAAGIRLRPTFYLSNEYGCVERTEHVGLLWVDALDQIPALWRKYRDRARDAALLLRILRHETGHAFCYAHRLYRRRDFRRLFGVRGPFFRTYPDDGWAATPRHEKAFRTSGAYINIRAMKHPDEDFAITFQTWLNPDIDWRARYAPFPRILEKLEWTGAVVREVGKKPGRPASRRLDKPVSELTMTVGEWFGGAGSRPRTPDSGVRSTR